MSLAPIRRAGSIRHPFRVLPHLLRHVNSVRFVPTARITKAIAQSYTFQLVQLDHGSSQSKRLAGKQERFVEGTEALREGEVQGLTQVEIGDKRGQPAGRRAARRRARSRAAGREPREVPAEQPRGVLRRLGELVAPVQRQDAGDPILDSKR